MLSAQYLTIKWTTLFVRWLVMIGRSVGRLVFLFCFVSYSDAGLAVRPQLLRIAIISN